MYDCKQVVIGDGRTNHSVFFQAVIFTSRSPVVVCVTVVCIWPQGLGEKGDGNESEAVLVCQ
jgi:DNA-directed RNA polymerase subunit E'/Rpb7